MTQILELLPKLMQQVGPILKEQENKQQKYRFRGVEQVLQRLQPQLIQLGMSLSVAATEHSAAQYDSTDSSGKPRKVHVAAVTLAVTITAPDGSSVTNSAAGEGMDHGGDKATSKAMSMAFKYAMFFGLCIPVDRRSIDDGDRNRRTTDGDPQLEKFKEIQKTIGRETDPAKLTKFKPLILQRVSEGAISETYGELLTQQLRLKLENVQA
jgi:hypothetical protein